MSINSNIELFQATYPNANYPHLSKRYRLIVPGAETNELVCTFK